MKIKKMFLFVLPAALAAGCVSHREAAYERSEVVAPSPTSRDAVVRVYPDRSGPGEAADTAVAETVRDNIERNPALKAACRRVDIEIKNGRAILRGTVATEGQRQEIRDELSNISGIGPIEDHLKVEIR